MNTRDRIKALGVSEERLSAIGLGAPSAAAADGNATRPNAFRRAYDAARAPKPVTAEARAASAAAVAAMPAAQAEQQANALHVFRTYSAADAITRTKIRGQYGSMIEAGRRVHEDQLPEPPEAA